MTKAIVNAGSGLNLRDKPGGLTIGSLSKGTVVALLDRDGSWWKIRAGRQSGFVAARYVSVILDTDTLKPGAIVVRGRDVIGPDGRVFAKTFRRGVFNCGQMSIHDYVAKHSYRFTHLSDSLLRVMQAVSANEGKLEAINTWDNAFLTFGCFQWTAGTGDSAGELPALIARLKKEKPNAFDTFFKDAGLDVAAGGETSPEKWNIADELRVLDLYLELRHKTSMTDSRKRAQRTLDVVRQGLASDQRNSFDSTPQA
mgnify:CR=1 FL=1|tara:strand:+ start:18645 stop:19409 length:765 start_codon:yes stop_codon:yes gene_type:complete